MSQLWYGLETQNDHNHTKVCNNCNKICICNDYKKLLKKNSPIFLFKKRHYLAYPLDDVTPVTF